MFLEESLLGLCLSRLLTWIHTCLISIRYLYALHSLLPPSLHLFSPSPSHILSCHLLAFVCVHVCLCVCASVCLCAEEACSAAGLPPDHQTAAGSLGQLFVCHEQPTGGECLHMCVWCVCTSAYCFIALRMFLPILRNVMTSSADLCTYVLLSLI